MSTPSPTRRRLRRAIPIDLTEEEIAIVDARAQAVTLSRTRYLIAALRAGMAHLQSHPDDLHVHVPIRTYGRRVAKTEADK